MRISVVAGGAAVLLAASTLLAGPASADEGKPLPVHTGAPDTVESEVAPMHCSAHAHRNADTRTGRFFDGSNVNIRRFPHTGCTSDGQGQLTHNVDYHCYGFGDSVTRNGVTYTTWTYLRDTTTGVQGWVSDAFLDHNPSGLTRGSFVECVPTAGK